MNIQDQIESLTQELNPMPKNAFYCIASDGEIYIRGQHPYIALWASPLFSSEKKSEVEDYIDCARRLRLYQLLGKKAEKDFPINWLTGGSNKYGTDFKPLERSGTTRDSFFASPRGIVETVLQKPCVLGGVWFSREEDRVAALEHCGIDQAFQERCAKYGLGGA
jgi:hypothetical protein